MDNNNPSDANQGGDQGQGGMPADPASGDDQSQGGGMPAEAPASEGGMPSEMPSEAPATEAPAAEPSEGGEAGGDQNPGGGDASAV